MKIIDAHCDVLSRMLTNPCLNFFDDQSNLDVTFSGLKKINALVQFFAVYLPESILNPNINHVLESINILHTLVDSHPNELILIRTAEDFKKSEKNNKIGAILSLEGVEGLTGQISHLETLYRLGVRAVGFAWNYANWAADGILEPRNGGFTLKGLKLIESCKRLGMIMDVSHLSVAGFWELVERTDVPFIASHSNAYRVCPHPRNLRDDQIKAIVATGGRIGITFVPKFVKKEGSASIADLLKHIDHVCGHGGERNVGFGSDFDGTEHHVRGLENAGGYENLINELLKHYKEEQVRCFAHRNWREFLLERLPG